MEWVDEGSINNYKYASRTIFSGFVTGQIVWVNKLSIRLLTSYCAADKSVLYSVIFCRVIINEMADSNTYELKETLEQIC